VEEQEGISTFLSHHHMSISRLHYKATQDIKKNYPHISKPSLTEISSLPPIERNFKPSGVLILSNHVFYKLNRYKP
jgi:hypothetical protein